jgi:hypothetical protein
MADRTPTNCQQEPPFDGLATVACSLRYPEMTCHFPTMLCGIQEPHTVSECGEWQAGRTTESNKP